MSRVTVMLGIRLRSYVIFGCASALASCDTYGLPEHCPPIRVFDGEHPFDDLGGAVAGAGDINHDGFDDVLVDTFGYDGPNGDPISRVCVHSGLTWEPIRCWVGEQAYGGFGLVAGAGDVDADGTPDLIFGAPGFHGAAGVQSGKTYVYSGATGGLIWSWEGDGEYLWFGTSVAGVGDINGDGHDDVAIGQPGPSDPDFVFPGAAYVYSGATGELIWHWMGDGPADRFGVSIAGAGDFDGDGIPDVIVGAHWNGSVYLFSGATGELIWYQEGEHFGDFFGARVAGVGDVNGDGFADVAIGAYYSHGTGPPGASMGKIYVYAGPNGDLLWSVAGEGPADLFGFSLAAAGDTNGDGVGDVIVGSYGHGGNGKAYVYSGRSGTLIWSADGEAYFDLFAFAVAGAGDVNNDGRTDVIVGAIWHDGPAGTSSGRAYVFTPVRILDCDCDGRFGLSDLAGFDECLSGPLAGLISPTCGCADTHADAHVDLNDFAGVQNEFDVTP